MLIRYCKECGHHLNFPYGENKGYCPICDKEVTDKDTIAQHTLMDGDENATDRCGCAGEETVP